MSFLLSYLTISLGTLVLAATGAIPPIPGAEREGNPKLQATPSQPPDGKWLKDQRGRPYFVHKLPKKGQEFHWVQEDRIIRILPNRVFWVERQDDEFFYVRIYGGGPALPAPNEASRQERKRVIDRYEVEVEVQDTLQFEDFGKGLPAAGQWRNGFDMADLNGDGSADLVHGPARKGKSVPVVFLGDGRGNWKRWEKATWPAAPYAYGDVAAADFNRDGKMDLAFAFHRRGMLVLVGDGDGEFSPWSDGIALDHDTSGSAFSSRAIEVVDWNRDGSPDLLALGEGPRLGLSGPLPQAVGLLLYLNQGNGTWTRHTRGPEARVFGDDLALGDFNGDNRQDVLTATSILSQRDILFLGLENGSWEPALLRSLRPIAFVRAVAVTDFDGDGKEDLILSYTHSVQGVTHSGVDLLYGRTDLNWERRALAVEAGREGVFSVETGDLNGDDAQDLVALTGAGEMWVWLGDGHGFLKRDNGVVPDPGRRGCRGYHVMLRDLNEDGRDEIIAAFAGEQRSLLGEITCAAGGALKIWKAVQQ